jgi:hypothetical protein
MFVENCKDLHEIPINNLVAYSRSQADRLTKREREKGLTDGQKLEVFV